MRSRWSGRTRLTGKTLGSRDLPEDRWETKQRNPNTFIKHTGKRKTEARTITFLRAVLVVRRSIFEVSSVHQFTTLYTHKQTYGNIEQRPCQFDLDFRAGDMKRLQNTLCSGGESVYNVSANYLEQIRSCEEDKRMFTDGQNDNIILYVHVQQVHKNNCRLSFLTNTKTD